MKTQMFFFLPLLVFFFWSCEKEEMESVEEMALSAVVLPSSFSAQEQQEIIVQITTGTPCYSIEVAKKVSDKTFEYNFIVTEEDVACIQVVKKHDVPVVFDPPSAGTYTLRFLINGEFHETREIIVTENFLIGTWQVLHFEDETQNIIMSSPESEEIVMTFLPSSFDGTTPRNEFEGKYQVQAKKILFTEYIATEAEDTEFGKLFYEVMGNGQTQPLPFEVDGDILKINYEEERYMVLQKVKD